MFLSIDFSSIWKGIRNEENHEKNTNITSSRTEARKRLDINAIFFSIWVKFLGEKKKLLMYYCLSDGPYMVPSALAQASMIKWYLFSSLYDTWKCHKHHTDTKSSIFTVFPSPKQNSKFCPLGVVLIITAADIAKGSNRSGSRKMWPEVHDFSSSCDS